MSVSVKGQAVKIVLLEPVQMVGSGVSPALRINEDSHSMMLPKMSVCVNGNAVLIVDDDPTQIVGSGVIPTLRTDEDSHSITLPMKSVCVKGNAGFPATEGLGPEVGAGALGLDGAGTGQACRASRALFSGVVSTCHVNGNVYPRHFELGVKKP